MSAQPALPPAVPSGPDDAEASPISVAAPVSAAAPDSAAAAADPSGVPAQAAAAASVDGRQPEAAVSVPAQGTPKAAASPPSQQAIVSLQAGDGKNPPAQASAEAVPNGQADAPQQSPNGQTGTPQQSPNGQTGTPQQANPQSQTPQIALQNQRETANNTGIVSDPPAGGPPTDAQGTSKTSATAKVSSSASQPQGAASGTATAQSSALTSPAVSSDTAAQQDSRQGATPQGQPGGGSSASQDSDPSAPSSSDSKTAVKADLDSLAAQAQPSAPPVAAAASGQAASKPLSPGQQAEVVRQTADGIAAAKPQIAADGQGQMTVQLHPKDWGDLKVTVNMTSGATAGGANSVVAHVVASSPEAKAALETNSADLQHALRETGLHLERLTVTLQSASASGQAGGAASDSRGFGQGRADQWQSAQSQTGAGSGAGTGGNAFSFASNSDRQGGSYTRPYAAQTASIGHTDGGDADAASIQPSITRPMGGFDQRA
jgi:flagellar hook-length control protein FliK